MQDMSWTQNPLLKDIDPLKMKIIKDLVAETDGKSVSLAMPALLKANNQLKKQGMTFTTEESALLMAILTKNMSAAEKDKLENMKQMFQNYSKAKTQ